MYTTAVFSGGGVRGLAFCGCIAALEEQGHLLGDVKEFIGVSAGSIAATAMGLGYTATEVFGEFCSMNFSDFNSINVCDILHTHGFNNGCKLEAWFKTLIAAKTGSGSTTFADFVRFTGKQLRIVVTCLETHSEQELCVERTPQLPLHTALRMSCSVPFVFQSVRYQGRTYVDGCLLNHFPTIYSTSPPRHTIGFRLVTSEEGERAPSSLGGHLSIEAFAQHVFFCLMNQVRKYRQTEEEGVAIVTVNAGEYSLLDIGVSLADKRRLFDIGKAATAKWLARE